jgi:hypothetical protein
MQRMTAQRVQDDPATRPLPSYEMPWIEAVDPDRTLKRRAIHVAPSANSTEEICADDVLEVIKVGRVPPGAESTQEIAAEDVIGVAALRSRVCANPLITVVPEPSIAPPAPPLPPPPRENRAEPLRFKEPERGSVAPVAMDEDFSHSRADSTFMLGDTPYGLRMPRMGYAIAGGLGAMIGIFVLVFALGSAGAKPVVQMGQHAAPGKAATAAAGAAAAVAHASRGEASSSTVPTIDVASLPQAAVGTVSLAKSVTGHRLFVDGVVASAGSAIVSCGKHLVKVGSKGRKQEVDVACGSEVAVGY